jgi:predicted protein tyrosine phosphatase
MDGIEVSSAGTSVEAECPVSADLLQWADRVFDGAKTTATSTGSFCFRLEGQEGCCLSIPDTYSYMQPELVEMLRKRVLRHLRR